MIKDWEYLDLYDLLKKLQHYTEEYRSQEEIEELIHYTAKRYDTKIYNEEFADLEKEEQ